MFSRTITDLADSAETLRAGRYGVIETVAGRLVKVTLRPLPLLLSWREIVPVGPRWRPGGPVDRCRLYYCQPRGHEGFLALRYVCSTPGTSYATLVAALRTLDAIAAIKGSDALVCDAANRRISDRFLARMGWEPHARQRLRRNYIRRFYGDYPQAALRSAGLAG